MHLGENLKIGIKELLSNKLRSFLTMLGVIFGVAAVIAIVSIGEGAREEALQQIRLMGANNLCIQAVELSGDSLANARQKNPQGLNLKDVELITNNCKYALNIAPLVKLKHRLIYKGRFPAAQVIATTDSYPKILNFKLAMGRFFNQDDIDNNSRVCVLGSDVAKELSPTASLLGEQVRILDYAFTVIGIMEDKDISGSRIFSIRDLNKDVYIPITSVIKRFPVEPDRQHQLDEILVKLGSQQDIPPALSLVKRILNRAHNNIKDFEIVIPLQLLRQQQQTQRIFNIVMGFIAGISLLVGGIGIMNIMLTTVVQRTREIGIRRAIGATKINIMQQFLIECLIMAILGGTLGIFLGIELAYLINLYARWRTIISIKAILVAFIVAGLTGIIFGLFPAYKAADLDPIDALRYE